jgi:hypothetical protein
MNGQWIGRYSGTNSGLLVIDCDDMETHYAGTAFAYDDDPALPTTFALVNTPDKTGAWSLNVELSPLDRQTMEPSTWDTVAPQFAPGTTFPRRAEMSLTCDNDKVSVSWKTDIGTASIAELPKSRASAPTDYEPSPEISS